MQKIQLDGGSIFVIEGFFSAAECQSFIELSEKEGFDEAPITVGNNQFLLQKDVRNNTRVMIDDPTCAARLWTKLEPFVDAKIGNWQPIGLNERLRYYRYDRGEKFAPHYDGAFQRDNGEKSQLTFMVYLNEGFRGGDTVFHRPLENIVVKPVTGKALLFRHRQLHEGAPVIEGRKYVLRSDVMCRYVPPELTPEKSSDSILG